MALQINNPKYGNVFVVADTFEELRSVASTKIQDGYSSIVNGDAAPGDGLGGLLVWTSNSTATDDGETVIAPANGQQGRWIKVAVGQVGAPGPAGPVSTVPGPAGPIGPSGTGPNSLASYGAISTPVNALATLTAAFANLGSGGVLFNPTPANIGTTAPRNPGVEIDGHSGIYYSPADTGSLGYTGGQRPVNKIGREFSKLSWGQEYLVPRFLTRLKAGQSISVGLIGDSNTEGFAGPLIAALFAKLPNTTVVNYGVGGSTFEQWRIGNGNIPPAKNMASVLAANHDLLIDLYGGTNDAYYGLTPTDFYNSKRTGYQAIRASANGGVQRLSIVMCTAGPMSDGGLQGLEGGYKRDERFNFEVRPKIIALASEFSCAFSDKNGRVPDAFVDFLNGGAQNSVLDSNRVHTSDTLSAMIAQWVYEDTVPSAFRTASTSSVMFGDITTGVTPQLPPSAYPVGFSISRANGGSPAWPHGGFVATFTPVSVSNFSMQIEWGYGGSAITDSNFSFRRAVDANTWTNFTLVGTAPVPAPTLVNPGSGWGLPTSEAMQTQANGNIVHAQGYVNPVPNVAKIVPANTLIATVAVIGHRPAIYQWWVNLLVYDGTNWERIRGNVGNDGTIKNVAASTLAAVRVYVEASWLTVQAS